MTPSTSSRDPRYLILIIFIGISAIVAIGGYFYYTYRKESLREEKLNDLKAISDLKEAQILSWKAERIADAKTIFYNPFMRKNFNKIFDQPAENFRPVFSPFIHTAKEEFGYHKIIVFSRTGDVIASSNPDQAISKKLIQQYLDISLKSEEIYFSGFELDNDSLPLLNLIVPIVIEGKYGGFALLQLDPAQYLFPLIEFWPTPSESSETLIFSVQEDDIIFLNELRHQQHSSFRVKIPLTEEKVAAVMAVEGIRGFVEAEDYRGHAIIAYLKKIPGTDWFMVAKTDQDEIFQPMQQEATLISAMIILLVIFTGVISYLLFRNYLSSFFIRQVSDELGLKSAEDIALRKRHENRIQKLNRLYATLISINQAIVRSDSREQIMQELCLILIEKGGYRMVSIEQQLEGKISIIASAGHVDGYYDQVEISANKSPTGGGPIGNAYKTKKYVVCQDIENDPLTAPWRREALRRKYRSSAAFPIISHEDVTSVINIYSDSVGWFDEEEIHLLEQFSYDIAFVLEFFFIEKERKEFRDELEASEERFQQVFNSMNDGIAIHELVYDDENKPVDYRLLDVNPVFEEITSIPYKTAIGSLGSVLYQMTPPPYLDTYAEVAQTGKPIVFEVYYTPMEKHFRISAFSQHKDRFTTVFQDITSQVEAREYLKKMNVELEKRVAERTLMLETANNELESFAYSVSHDLKAPLRSISGFSHILDSRYSSVLDEDGKHYLQNIIQAGDNMHMLIEDLLRYARLGQTKPALTAIDIKTILEKSLTDLHAGIEATHAMIKVPEETSFVRGNPMLLGQVFTNLIANGMTYQPDGQKPETDISWKEEKEHLIISVTDNGIGIPGKFHEKVFQMFQRLHREDQFQGTGIGLAIVKKAVEIQEGEVWISSSKIGSGSTLCVKLLKSDKT